MFLCLINIIKFRGGGVDHLTDGLLENGARERGEGGLGRQVGGREPLPLIRPLLQVHLVWFGLSVVLCGWCGLFLSFPLRDDDDDVMRIVWLYFPNA